MVFFAYVVCYDLNEAPERVGGEIPPYGWGFVEALAYASFLTGGYHVQRTGQDAECV